jgi:hypothetical protein
MAQERKQLSALTDEELLREFKKMKSASITNAVLIGILIGVVVYSILKSSFGLFTLIPLFFAYKLMNSSKYNGKELDAVLKERNLK